MNFHGIRNWVRAALGPSQPSIQYVQGIIMQPEHEAEHLHLVKGKGKVKLPLYLTKHPTMKTYWESGGIAPHIL
jgi:hypothetical protein